MARQKQPDRLERILDAAFRVFGDRGLAAAKMSDVAAAAGVSQGTLYNYVASKEALFNLLLERGLGRSVPEPQSLPANAPSPSALAERMGETVATTFALPRLDAALRARRVVDARGELAAIIHELFERTAETREAADVLERSAREVPELAAVFYGKVRRGLVGRLRTLMERRIALGLYRPRDPAVLARFVIESVTLFARHIHHDVEPPGFDLLHARDEIVETLCEGIVLPSSRVRPASRKKRS